MQYGALQITFNTISDIPLDQSVGFKLFSSIKEGLPYGYVNILDRDSTFAEFPNLQIGADCSITIINVNDEEDKITFPTFKVLMIENSGSVLEDVFVGIIKVWFGHPWLLYKDIRNHAYKPTNSAELIKKIIRGEDRGMAFEADDKCFDKTDDSGVARYKICETDWDFIQNKVLPYATVQQLPTHFFCNAQSQFYLRSFKNMYSENSKIIYIPSPGTLGDDKNMADIDKICNDNNIDKDTGLFTIGESSVQIGGFDMLKEIYPKFFFENLTNNSFIHGKKRVSNELKKKTGTSYGNLLPLDAQYMMEVQGTSTKVLHNRQLLDSLSFLFEGAKSIDEMFTVTITSPFNGNHINIGNTANIYVPPIDTSVGNNKKHWLNGKWLTVALEHHTDDEDPRKIMTKSTLVRPTFVGNDKSSSLTMSALLYSS